MCRFRFLVSLHAVPWLTFYRADINRPLPASISLGHQRMLSIWVLSNDYILK